MQVCITGGAGFIGSALARHALELGHSGRLLDDLSTGSLSNLEGLLDHPRLTFLEGSCLDAARVSEAAEGCELIFHLAAVVGVSLVHERAVSAIQTNVIGTDLVLHEALRRGAKVFLASSSEVYGLGESGLMSESSSLQLGRTDRPRGAYGCTKALDEWLAFAYQREQGLRFVIGRFFNTSGPRQSARYGMVLPRFVRSALSGEPLTVYGDGQQTRCFCHVSDVVDAVWRLAQSPQCEGQIYNVANEQRVSIESLARRVIERCESRSELRYVPFTEIYGEGAEDPRHRLPCTQKIQRDLGWAPQRSLDVLIDDLIDFVQGEA